MTDGPEAFVPGHITGLFSVHRTDDAARTGSRGVGVTLTDGVTVRVTEPEPTDPEPTHPEPTHPETTLNDEPIGVESVTRVLGSMDVHAHVHAETPLPLGAGFGVSGAMALGAAFAANAFFDCEYTENDLVRLAHIAEVESESGLGDVVAQARGGAPIRLDPGAPPYGRLDGIPETGQIEYVTFGERSTEDVISGDTTLLSDAGQRGLQTVRDHPTLETFVAASRAFASDAALLTDDVETVIGDVETSGGSASMAMLGRTVFALGSGLSDAGYDAERCRIHPAGATLR